MRWNLRIKIGRITLFGMIAKTQAIGGITSLVNNVGKVDENIHILMWDLEDENLTLNKAILYLCYVQQKYNIGEIFIYGESEKKNSFRAISLTRKPFTEFLQILLDTKYVDYMFFKYTVMRGKATLRLTDKENRKTQKVLYVLKGKKEELPKRVERVLYDTGLVKLGKTLELVH